VDCQQGKGRVTSVIGGQANTATRGRISDPEDIAADAGQQIEQACASLGKEVGGRTVAQLSQAHEKANPPLEISIQADGFEAELRRMIRRPRGQILQEDYDRVGTIRASSKNGDSASLKDLRFLQKLRNLTEVYLSHQSITDLKSLSFCTSIKTIYFNSLKEITDIRVLEELKELNELGLEQMPSLKRAENSLVKLGHLKKLKVTMSTPIKSWSFIKSTNVLESLTVSPDADFPTIAKLNTLNSLEVLISGEGGSKKLPNLTDFGAFQHLDELSLSFHHIAKTLSAVDLNTLKAMLPGVAVKVTETGGN